MKIGFGVSIGTELETTAADVMVEEGTLVVLSEVEQLGVGVRATLSTVVTA
jgi:hypothetical protein